MADGNALLASLLMGQKRRSDPLEQQQKYGASLMQQGSATTPVLSPWEGVARALQGGLGGLMTGYANQQQEEQGAHNIKQYSSALAATTPEGQQAALSGLKGGNDQTLALLGQMLVEKQKTMRAGTQADTFEAAYRSPGAPPSSQQASSPGTNATAIAGIESQGQPNGGYGAVGPVANAQGNRAYGKYQVLDSNIAPWTQEVLGKPMSPQEFLANPEAQNKVFEAKFGQYVTQYGSPQAASRAWFAGPGGMNNPNARDVNGTTVAGYEGKFNGALNPSAALPSNQPTQPQIAQGDSVPQGAPPAVAGPPDVPRPQPSPEQVAKYKSFIASGQMTGAQAVHALDQEVTQEWGLRRQQAHDVWKSQQEDERINKKAATDLGAKAPMELITKRVDNYENKLRPAATAAANDIIATHAVRQVLDSGAFTGTGAEAKTMLAKIGEQFGIPSDMAVNTQVLGATLAKRTLAASGGSLGTGFSNADRDFVERASGGTLAMDEAAMRKLADISERQSRLVLKQHDEEVSRMRQLPGVAQLGDGYFKTPDAPSYGDWSKANPAQPVQGVVGASSAQGAPAQPAQQNVARPQSKADFDAMPSGTAFIAPDGSSRVKP